MGDGPENLRNLFGHPLNRTQKSGRDVFWILWSILKVRAVKKVLPFTRKKLANINRYLRRENGEIETLISG